MNFFHNVFKTLGFACSFLTFNLLFRLIVLLLLGAVLRVQPLWDMSLELEFTFRIYTPYSGYPFTPPCCPALPEGLRQFCAHAWFAF
jgi:hypothetical protein